MFCMYGVFWLMPKQVELLDSWNNGVGWHQTELFIYLFRRGLFCWVSRALFGENGTIELLRETNIPSLS